MSAEKEKTIYIPSFPLDDQEYIITNWGLLRKNPSPEASVFLVEIKLESLKGHKELTVEIIFTHLFVARIVSVWKNQKLIRNYECKKRSGFKSQTRSFSLCSSTPSSTKLVVKSKTSESGGKSIIDIDQLDQNWHIVLSVFTVFTTPDGMEVFIPSLEILLSTYAPNTHTVLHDIIISSVDNVVQKHLRDWHLYKDGYYIDPVGNYHISTKFLLAYLSCNSQTRVNVSKIRSSLENNKVTKKGIGYSFVEVFPYHPDVFNIKVTGLYDKKNKRFWVHQIRSYALPAEYEIAYEEDNTESIQRETAYRKLNNENVVTEAMPLSDDTDAGRNAGKVYLKSEIEIKIPLDKVCRIRKNTKKPEALAGKVKPHKAEAASASPLSGQNASKPIAAIEHKDKDREKHLNILIDAIRSLGREVYFLADDLGRNRKAIFCSLERQRTYKGTKSSWAFIAKDKPRKLLVCEICLPDRIIYILDIERKNTDTYAGIMFSLPRKIDNGLLKKIKDVISTNQGRFGGDKERKKFPVDGYKTFRHYSDRNRMKYSIHSLVNKI